MFEVVKKHKPVDFQRVCVFSFHIDIFLQTEIEAIIILKYK